MDPPQDHPRNDEPPASRDPAGEPDVPDPGGTTFVNHPPEWPTASRPERIGPYVVRGVIGTGGMGRVFLAFDQRLDRVVAIKVVRSGFKSSHSLRQFEEESRLLARVTHEGIARVYDTGVERFSSREAPTPYFVMEYLPDALSLTAYAVRHNLNLAQRLQLFLRVCEAVQAAHSQGIIHRDLKPSNILVSSAEPPDTAQPKVIDFGVARLEQVPSVPDGAGLVGTLEYMSPEQCAGGAIDTRSDVYSLGVVLYKLLADALPYEVPTGEGVTCETTRIIREVEPRPLSELNPSLAGDLEAISLRTLAKDPQHRYQTARELGDDIKRVLADEPVAARKQSRAYVLHRRTGSMARRQRIVAIAACVAAGWSAAAFLGVPLVYRWTQLHSAYIRVALTPAWMSRFGPAPTGVLTVLLPADVDVPRLAASTSTSVTPAGSYGIPNPGVERSEAGEPLDPMTMYATVVRRSLTAKLLERLCMPDAPPDRRASAVAIDQFYIDVPPQEGWAQAFALARDEATEKLAAAAERLKREGHCATVAALYGWRGLDEDIGLAPSLQETLRFGGITARFPPRQVAADLLLLREGKEPAPSLAILAFALRGAGDTCRPGFIVNDRSVDIIYNDITRDRSGLQRPIRPFDRVPISFVDDEHRKSDEAASLGTGESLAALMTELPPDAYFERATIPIGDLLAMKETDLSNIVGGKVILLAKRELDMQTCDDGREVPGYYGHVAAIESLLARAAIITPNLRESTIAILAGCAAGVWIAGRRAARWGWGLLLIALSIAGCMALFRFSGYALNPTVPLLGAGVSGIVYRIAGLNRHIGSVELLPKNTGVSIP